MMNIFAYSLAVIPTVLFGYVSGPAARLEAASEETVLISPNKTGWIFYQKPISGFAYTHLQKTSRFGFLITWPFCIHFYFTFKYQERDEQGNWIPGTERVLYGRTPGYRKDIDYGMKWTWGYLGLHWD